MIRVSCSFHSSIGRFQLEDYVRELDVAVFAFDDVGQQVMVGKLRLPKSAGRTQRSTASPCSTSAIATRRDCTRSIGR